MLAKRANLKLEDVQAELAALEPALKADIQTAAAAFLERKRVLRGNFYEERQKLKALLAVLEKQQAKQATVKGDPSADPDTEDA